MKKLIQALEIFAKYQDLEYPTNCEHDELVIAGITFEEVSEEDRELLDKLDFFWSDENEGWTSFKYGSA